MLGECKGGGDFGVQLLRELQWWIQDLLGGANPRGASTYYFAKICQKLHENEENWTGERVQNFTM